MDKGLVIGISFGYLLLLFGIAYWAEKGKKRGALWFKNPYTYALALAVYCTAWTYFGSVGRAAESGVDFLTIYLGPTIFAPIWYLLVRKMVRISKVQKISTLSDFVAARYGKSLVVGGLVAIMAVLGVLPYISIQLKAISESFDHLTGAQQSSFLMFGHDTAFYIALTLAFFTIIFGTRKIDSTEHQTGLISAIAFESVFKLVAFLAVGIFVTYGLFDGFSDLFMRAIENEKLKNLMTFSHPGQMADWFWLSLLSMLAVLLLPRQFQMAIKENTHEKHLDKAIWLLPMYLLLINIFVFPIALAGTTLLGNQVNADQYVLALPLSEGQTVLSAFVYLGGFSAATGMIIVSTIALSMMMTNSVLVPALAVNQRRSEGKGKVRMVSRRIILMRRISIVGIVFLAYLYYRFVGERFSLVSIGLISFVAVAQFAPAVIGGLLWKRATATGAMIGMLSGFVIWSFTLVVPTVIEVGLLPGQIMTEGLWGQDFLRPQALLGMQGMSMISHGFFWSMFFNALGYVIGSMLSRQNSRERNQAEVFVDIFKYSTVYESSIVWKGQAYLPDIKALLSSFLGQQKTESIFRKFIQEQRIDDTMELADFRLVNFAEKQLAAAIGTTSAHIMMSSIVREEDISFEEVFEILQESQQIKTMNKELKEKSKALEEATLKLKTANEELVNMDQQKDEFITTVTHELRTPITSIKAFSEILHDNQNLEDNERLRFLSTIIKETERMERLINQVLDLEKFDSGKQKLNLLPLDLDAVIRQAAHTLEKIVSERNVDYSMHISPGLPKVLGDEDRLMQVMLNLLSNAIKFCNTPNGMIAVAAYYLDGEVKVNVTDNGPGIPKNEEDMIFQSFYQSSDQNRKKPKGSGLGLTITKKIIELHNGRIWVSRLENELTRFSFTIPAIEAQHLNRHEPEESANR